MYPDSETNEMVEEIIKAYAARLEVVKGIVNNTHGLLAEFRIKRETISSQLREFLAKSESLRKKDFDGMMKKILTMQRQREDNVKGVLQVFQQEEEAIVERLRNLAGKGDAVRIKDFKRMLAKIKDEQQKREKDMSGYVTVQVGTMQHEVGELLEEFKKERGKMAAEWARLATTLPSHIAGSSSSSPQQKL